MRLNEIVRLDELVAGYTSPNGIDGANLIAHRGKYWIINNEDEITPQQALQIERQLGRDTDLEMDDELVDVGEWIDRLITDDRKDIISGVIRNGTLYMSGQFNIQYPTTSLMIKKLVKQLGLHDVEVEAFDFRGELDDGNTFYQHDIKGELPNWLYHGTSSEHLKGILTTGLMAGKTHNWANIGIRHNKVIFGTLDFETAKFHAARTTFGNEFSGYDDVNYYDDTDPFPVVIKFTIPDKNLIIPDYDIWNDLVGRDDSYGYSDQKHQSNRWYRDDTIPNQHPEGKLWKSTGIFGYKGRIPPNHITQINTWWWDSELDGYGNTLSPKYWKSEYQVRRDMSWGFDDEDE